MVGRRLISRWEKRMSLLSKVQFKARKQAHFLSPPSPPVNWQVYFDQIRKYLAFNFPVMEERKYPLLE